MFAFCVLCLWLLLCVGVCLFVCLLVCVCLFACSFVPSRGCLLGLERRAASCYLPSKAAKDFFCNFSVRVNERLAGGLEVGWASTEC